MMAPQRYMIAIYCLVTGQRQYANSRIANSRTGQVADCTTRGLAMPPKERKLSMQSRRWHPRDVQSASWQSASCRIRELSSNLPFYNKQIVQISSMYEFCAVSQSQTTNASRFYTNLKQTRIWNGIAYRLTRRFKYVNAAETDDWNVHFCAGVTGQGNQFVFIPTV